MQCFLPRLAGSAAWHSKFQDTTQAILDSTQIHCRKLPLIPSQAPLVDRAHLIAHRNRIWPGRGNSYNDWRARLWAGRKGYDHDCPPRPVERIGCDHNGRSRLSNFAALGGIEIDPPDFASARRRRINCRPGSRHRERSGLASDARPSSMVAVSHSAISAANASSCSTASATR